MALAVKICGLNDAAALRAAITGGARYLGFVFYPPSPRAVTIAQAAALAALVPADRIKVGLFVDPDDALLDQVLAAVPLDALQLHGREPPARLAAIKARHGRTMIRALQVAAADDLQALPARAGAADIMLFDAKPPPAALPGGNGISFDWRLLADVTPDRPWLLAGGLGSANLAAALACCRPDGIDVSSGVEQRPGRKDPAKIQELLSLAATLDRAGQGCERRPS